MPPAGPPSFLTCQSPRGALGPSGVVGITLHMPDGTFSGESSAFRFPSFLVRFSMGSGTSEACRAQAGAITGLPPDPTFQGPLTRPHLGLRSYCALCPERLPPSLLAPPPSLCVRSAAVHTAEWPCTSAATVPWPAHPLSGQGLTEGRPGARAGSLCPHLDRSSHSIQ